MINGDAIIDVSIEGEKACSKERGEEEEEKGCR